MALAKRKASQISTTDDDEPVLSHAEQRRQKKLKQNKDHTIPPPTKNSGPKRQNSVWVGNLSFKTTPISLKNFFDGVGEITRINLPMKPPNGKGPRENSGYIIFLLQNYLMTSLQ
jgi:RNA recognition motif-containing protein